MNVRLGSAVLVLVLVVLSLAACSSSSSNKAEASCTTQTGELGFLTTCGGGDSLPPCTLGHSYAQLPNCTPQQPAATEPKVAGPTGGGAAGERVQLVTVPSVVGKSEHT